jgi:hypothetical protein
MRFASRLRACITAASLMLVPVSVASAETQAEQLFRQGRELFDKGQLGLACDRFRESQELEPRVGTALNLARCEEQRGHLAAALEAWRVSATLAEEVGDERVTLARERTTQIDPTVPRLTLVAPPGAPSETTYRLLPPQGNPTEIEPATGVIRVDVGVTTVVIEAPGHRVQRTEIPLEQGEVKSVELSLGEAIPTLDEGGEGMHPLTLTGYVVGGVGVVGIGVGAALGLLAKSKLDAADDPKRGGCDQNGTLCDTQDGVDLRQTALQFATGSTISFVAGGVLAATGVVLVLVAPSGSSDAEVALVPTASGAMLSGRF